MDAKTTMAVPVGMLVLGVGMLLAGCRHLDGVKETGKQAGNYVRNGDLEQVANGRFPHWKVTGNVKPEQVSGVWHRYTVRFNSGKFSEVNFYFHVSPGSMGSLWIDNVACPSARITNADFEEQTADGRPTQWNVESSGADGRPAQIAPWNVSIFLDPSRASAGQKSLRITHKNDAVPRSRISQRMSVEPNREYAISYDVLVGADFQGEAIGYVFDSTGMNHLTANYDDNWISWQLETRDRCDTYVAVLSPTATTPANMFQKVRVNPGMNLQARLDINNKAFAGTAKLIVEDPDSGKVLGEASVTKVSGKWQRMQVPLQTRSPKLLIRVVAEGSGTLQVDTVAVTPPTVIPSLQRVNWLSAAENFVIPSPLKVFVQGQTGPAIDGGLELLNKDLKPYGIVAEKTDSANAPVKIFIGTPYELTGKGDEAYALAVDAKGIVIKAGTDAGAFYGVMTLLQLINNRDGKPVALACAVTDYPDMPMRGTLHVGTAEELARWKMNWLGLGTGYPVSPKERTELAASIRECERLNIKTIPFFMSLFGGYYVEGKNPNLAAGIWVKDESLTLRGVEPTPLTNRYVIRTGLTDVKLKSADGKDTYVLGKDYRVSDGDMALWYDNAAAKPFAVARLPGSAIPDGGTVLASYDYVSHYRQSSGRTEVHIPYCPVEPQVRELMGEHFKSLARDFAFPYICPMHCLEEFAPAKAMLETDSRVINSGKKPIELLAEDVCFLDKAAKAGNPKVRILQWAGQANDNCRAASPLLPRDESIWIWGYDATWPVAYGRAAVDYWSKSGFETSVVAWDSIPNIRGWAQVVAEARKKGYPCVGMWVSDWGQKRFGGFQETANVSWKIPKPGEKGFVALPKAGAVKPNTLQRKDEGKD